MEIGIFSRTFDRPTLADTLAAVLAHDLRAIQLNLRCAGLSSMPEQIPSEVAEKIRLECVAHRINVAAISGTFNLIHPDPAIRNDGLRRLQTLASACSQLGTSIITLCTGTRDPENMWRWHPENESPCAWRDLLGSLNTAIRIAEECDVTLAIEPEVSNVVDSARKARRLLDEMRSLHLKVVIDGANLFHVGELARMTEVLDEAFDLLGPDVVLAHAKDVARDGEAGHEAAGTGVLDYDHYLALLHYLGYRGPLILHSLRENQVDEAVTFLRRKIFAPGARSWC